jgi:hypothetical protein
MAAGQGQSSGLVDGSGVHARVRVLASRDRGVAVLCVWYGVPGPRHDAAAGSDGGCGEYGGAKGSCNTDGTKAGTGGWGS